MEPMPLEIIRLLGELFHKIEYLSVEDKDELTTIRNKTQPTYAERKERILYVYFTPEDEKDTMDDGRPCFRNDRITKQK